MFILLRLINNKILYIVYNMLHKLSFLVAYKRFLAVLLIAAILIVIAIYIYKKYIKNKTPEKLEGFDQNNNSDKSVDLYLFYTEWCPHCKKTKPEWEKFKSNYANGQKINGYTINFIEVDCDANEELATKFKIEGYPTIKLMKGNQIIEFDAKPDEASLQQFLSNVLTA